MKQKKLVQKLIATCFAIVIGISTLCWVLNLNKSTATGGGTENPSVNLPIISAGNYHTLAIQDGELFTWGLNDSGQLGDGTNEDKNFPVKIGNATNWVSVTAGAYHSLAINELGELWVWGRNNYGQLGDGTNGTGTNKNTPVKIGDETNWASVSAGNGHSLAINALGELYTWGYNNYGQLGNGNTSNKNTPVKIGYKTNWVSISAGGSHSLAINTLGELWAWGFNGSGQLGTTGALSSLPVKIGDQTNWVSISAGNGHSLAINTLGELYAWGSGPIGDGLAGGVRYSPVKIGSETNWVSISAGSYHSLAINELGELYAWGDNAYGQLGDGTSDNKKNTPVKIGDKTNWVNITAGVNHSLAINELGELWAWGHNGYYQLGLGDNNDHRNVPTEVIFVGSNVSAPSSDLGYTCSAPTTYRVRIGGTYTFAITLDANYICPIVTLNTANGKLSLSSIDNNIYYYIITNVIGNITTSNFTVTISRITQP